MPICTADDIFDFVGAEDDVKETQADAVTTLIANVEVYIEGVIGRKITPTVVTDVILEDGLHCTIIDRYLYLKGIYRDLYSVSSLTEKGVTLTAVTGYDSGGDYYLDKVRGCLVRESTVWDTSTFSIKLSGSVGIGGATAPNAIKQCAIELVASKSGLWKQNVLTEGGSIDTIRTTPSKDTLKTLKSYVLRS